MVGTFYFWQTVWSQPYWNRPFVTESRERIIRSILNGAWQRPLTGWGWANVDYVFNANPWPMKFQSDIYLDKAHSTILEIFAATGIIGLSLYLLIIARGIWLSRRTAVFLPLVLYLLYSQTNATSIATEVIFWLTLGISSSSLPLSHSPRSPRPNRSISRRPLLLNIRSLFLQVRCHLFCKFN